MAPGPRERLLTAARELTYAHGVGIGIDAILREADVARRSLYHHFGGKDGLIAEVLHAGALTSIAHYRETMDAAGSDPRTRLLAVFDGLHNVSTSEGFRGCRFTAADLALADPDHPAHAETLAYRKTVLELLTSELRALNHPAPERGANQLYVLIDGVLVAGATRPDSNAAPDIRALAEYVLDG